MIHAFALEPKVVATWGRREEFRFIHDKFGPGTPRVLLELPGFPDWKNAVYSAAAELDLSEKDWKRLEEVFRIFSEHRCRRAAAVYADVLTWLENAEREHARHAFRAIVAIENPRRHAAVVVGDDLGLPKAKLWACATAATPPRSANDLATALAAMLVNCRELHLVDPHFGLENTRYRDVLESLIGVLASHAISLDVIRVHCSDKAELGFFEQAASKMAARLPAGYSVEFVRWKQKEDGGEKFHNRYVLTDLGGVSLGVGLDAGKPGETDDVQLLSRPTYDLRWSQYVGINGAFDCVDKPKSIRGTRIAGGQP